MPSIKKHTPNFTLDDIDNLKKKIGIIRRIGGLGDILVSRMIFQDIKETFPDCELIFSCPKYYHDAVKNHPFIDKIIDTEEIPDFLCSYDITDACNAYEFKTAPYVDKNRSDIWAEHCGVVLKHHEMHLNITEEEKDWAKSQLSNEKTVLVMPVSAMSNKDLEGNQILPVIDQLRDMGFFVYSLHNRPLPYANTLCNLNLRQWMAMVDAADWVISVDTAVMHCRGGLHKPMVAIFTWGDGKIIGKYYEKMVLVQKHRDDDPEWTCGPCHRFDLCIKTKEHKKPCCTEITSDMIMDGFRKMIEKH